MQILATVARETLLNLRSKAGLVLVTLLMVSLSFVVFDIFLVVTCNLGEMLEREKEQVGIELFLDRDMTEASSRLLADRISEMEGVRSVYYVSSAEAEAIFRAEFPDKQDIADALGDDFLLPASLQVSLVREWRSDEAVTSLARTLEGLEGVSEVIYGEDYLPGLTDLVTNLRNLALFAGIILSLSISLVVANTIRLAVTQRALTVEMMSVVGAPRWVVNMPFMLEGGLVYGLGGSLGGLGLTALSSVLLSSSIDHRFLPSSWIACVLLVGMIIGLVGSRLGLLSAIPRPRA